jgi:hypothetical protein
MKNFCLFFFVAFICCNNTTEVKKDYTSKHIKAATYCKTNQFNEDYYFLIDMNIHSGKNRFFIYDFKKSKIIDESLVTHGACDHFQVNPTNEKAKFSNKVDSHCSMKGKFKIGKRDYSSWGIHVKYWLHGLEVANRSAVDRVVVLHSWSEVSNQEIYPEVSPLSWRCPAVSDLFMKKLDEKLQESKKPVLLWIMD